MRSAARSAVLIVLLLSGLAMSALPALAHPFGPPLQVELEGLNYVVNLRWTAQEDDWIALARHVGAFEEVPVSIDGEELTGAQRIPRSEQVRDYLQERITVTQLDEPCSGEIVDFAEDLVNEGVVLQFTCESQVSEVVVGISVLHDVHESYRTVATAPQGGDPGTALYTPVDPTHRWDFFATVPPSGSLDGRTIGLLASALLALLALGILLLGRRRPSAPGPEGQEPEPPEDGGANASTDDRSPAFAGTEQVR